MLILASGSPRRRELLTTAGIAFTVVVADTEETLDPALSPEGAAIAIAREKAAAVFAKHPNDTVVGADTIVVFDEHILGKPADEADAARMLALLSGREHTVYTGVCILGPHGETVFSQATVVEFYPLTPAEITAYVASGEPMDKAGAYGIQGLGCVLVKALRGDYFNVMGLPVARLVRELRALGTV